MHYEDWISYRYLTAKKSRFLSFLNFISVAGVAIGVMSLIVVIGVMAGFGNNLREKIVGTTPHIMIEKEIGIRDFAKIEDKVNTVDGVTSVSAYIQGNIFLESNGQAMGVVVRGIQTTKEDSVTRVKQYLVDGKMDDLRGDGIVIGKELARYYGFKLGDQVSLISPGAGMAGQAWRYPLTIAGIFKTGMADFDMNLVVVDLAKAQQLFNLDPNEATGIGVKVKDVYQAEAIKTKLYELLGYGFLIRTWIDINRNLFEALFLEKWGLFIILTLMVIVASFNIISTLIVTVTSKIHDIGILQAIGVPRASIRKIFTKQGMLIGVTGIFWGLASGFGVCYILKTYIQVPAEIYSIDHVPVDIQLSDTIAIVVAAFVISYLATIYPASRAAKLQPVEALRYE
jgi:lipoprotein-releasing system permease protein